MDKIKLDVQTRESVGHKNAKQLRREGYMPAVVYGKGMESKNIIADMKKTAGLLNKLGKNTLVEIALGNDDILAIVKDIQYDPIKKQCTHVDFQAILPDSKIRTTIPVAIRGQELLSKKGGTAVLQVPEIEVECLPADLLEQIKIDVSAMDIGDRLYARDIKLPDSYKLLSSPEDIILVISSGNSGKVDNEEEDTKSLEEKTENVIQAM